MSMKLQKTSEHHSVQLGSLSKKKTAFFFVVKQNGRKMVLYRFLREKKKKHFI